MIKWLILYAVVMLPVITWIAFNLDKVADGLERLGLLTDEPSEDNADDN